MLWRFPAKRAAAAGAAISDASTAFNFVSPATATALVPALEQREFQQKKLCLTFDQALLGHLFIAEPQTWNIGRAEPENVFERAAHFAELQVHAEALEQFDQQARAFRENGLGSGSSAVESVISDHIDGRMACAVTHDVEKTASGWHWW